MADRIILHSDLNCFYASVEVNENPKLRDQAIAVCGSTEERHGIVLTASYPAKRRGVKTGMANWQAVRACPGLICVPPHYDLYVKYSRLVRNIYLRYTDKMEPYGMDECWLDVSGSRQLHGDGTAIAEEIRKAVRDPFACESFCPPPFATIRQLAANASVGEPSRSKNSSSSGMEQAMSSWRMYSSSLYARAPSRLRMERASVRKAWKVLCCRA